jgi:hypothetical protein
MAHKYSWRPLSRRPLSRRRLHLFVRPTPRRKPPRSPFSQILRSRSRRPLHLFVQPTPCRKPLRSPVSQILQFPVSEILRDRNSRTLAKSAPSREHDCPSQAFCEEAARKRRRREPAVEAHHVYLLGLLATHLACESYEKLGLRLLARLGRNSEAYCATDQSERPRRVFRRMADYAPLIHPTDLSSCGLTRASILFAKSSGRSASLSRSVIREI